MLFCPRVFCFCWAFHRPNKNQANAMIGSLILSDKLAKPDNIARCSIPPCIIAAGQFFPPLSLICCCSFSRHRFACGWQYCATQQTHNMDFSPGRESPLTAAAVRRGGANCAFGNKPRGPLFIPHRNSRAREPEEMRGIGRKRRRDACVVIITVRRR